jgi:MtrB/PioB family decaheme-associated outer membrane protein
MLKPFETPASTRILLAMLAPALSLNLAMADEPEVIEDGNVSVGVGVVGGSDADRAQLGQYNTVKRDRNAGAGLSVDYTLRNQQTLQWVDFKANDLLGDNRDLRLVYKKPGNWKLTLDYGELVRYDANTVNTGMTGLGSTTPTVNTLLGGAGTGADFDLNQHRKKLGLGLATQINARVQFQVKLGMEQKKGSRLAGVGMACPSLLAFTCGAPSLSQTGWATLFLPEPVSANHSQIDARLSYALDRLKFSVGYYGSFYRNDLATLTPGVPGSLLNGANTLLPLSNGLQSYLSQPLALAPDNQAHQLDVTGLYDINPTNRVNFKLAHAVATQDASFAGAGLTAGVPIGVTGFGGRLTTDLVKVGLVSRPMSKLTLLADWRYENRDDTTPLQTYAGLPWTNQNMSLERKRAKLQANWQFSNLYRGSFGVDVEDYDRGTLTPTAAVLGVSALRQNTSETTWSAALRRRMTEDVSGAVMLSRSARDGSVWLRPLGGAMGAVPVDDPATGFLPTSIFMPTLANRTRDKIRLGADWQTNDKLSMQFNVDYGQDAFSAPSNYGMKSTRMNGLSVDMNYAYSYAWNLNGYLSTGSQTLNQGWAEGQYMAFANNHTSLGLGFTGKLKSPWQLGGMLTYTYEKDAYKQTLDGMASNYDITTLAAAGGLPDIVYRQTQLKFFARYELDKRSAVRFDFIHLNAHVGDWAWGYGGVPYTYSDGTTLVQKPDQSANFLGVMYQHKWK